MMPEQIREHLSNQGWEEDDITDEVIDYFIVVWEQQERLHAMYLKAEDNMKWLNNFKR